MRVKFVRKDAKTPDQLYMDYLDAHKQGVLDAYHEVLEPVLIREGIDSSKLDEIEDVCSSHDESKYSEFEWDAYRDHFYDNAEYPRESDAFLRAWNHHQKTSPHHWQYWVLIQDDPASGTSVTRPLEMPLEYVIEMLCDWSSAGKHYGNTAYEWYQNCKNNMILHGNTRALVEKYVEYLK